MDIVYLNTKTKWNSNELRFSLRSAEKFLSFDNVYIVGYLPPFISPERVIHIPFKEDITHKWKNVETKINIILDNPHISNQFILMNDDFWIFRKYKTIPYYYNGTLEKLLKNKRISSYWERLNHTYKLFPKGKNFELHFPIVFDKAKLKRVLRMYGQNKLERRSAYCNEYKIRGVKSKDYKVTTMEEFKEMTTRKLPPFISATDEIVLYPEFQMFLMDKFPNPSSYEINDDDRRKKKVEDFIKLIEIYKKKNPAKYQLKKQELQDKLNSLRKYG